MGLGGVERPTEHDGLDLGVHMRVQEYDFGAPDGPVSVDECIGSGRPT